MPEQKEHYTIASQTTATDNQNKLNSTTFCEALFTFPKKVPSTPTGSLTIFEVDP